ncbi:hypothetical protein BKA93DRAFT_816505 [Sparassis latifolia]
MWEDFEMNDTDFDCGVDTASQDRDQLEHAVDNVALWNTQLDDDDQCITEDMKEDDELADIMENTGMMLLDTLDNLPRIAVSGSLMQVFLWILRETGARDVPSFDRLRKLQKNLLFIRCYPVIPDGPISEVHAAKWRKELDVSILSPMYDAGHGRHYYVQEFAQLQNGQIVIPVRWLEMEGTQEICADAHRVKLDENGNATIESDDTIIIKASDLQYNFIDLQDAGMIPHFEGDSQMPNPLRALADGDPLYTSFVDYWLDDVSGNRSKSYNKHWNRCITHRNLPRCLLQQECNIHFILTSQHATAPEQFKAFKDAVESTHREPVHVRDAETGEDMAFRIFVNAEPGDNPSQSECSGHIGGQGNYPCCKCTVGGTDKEKEMDVGYHALFEAREARSGIETLREVEKQLDVACTGIVGHVADMQMATGVKDAYTQYWIEHLIERAHRIKAENRSCSAVSIQAKLQAWVTEHRDDILNPFLTMKGFDPSKDTPYIMQYANSLIGRQLKTIAQTTVFHIHDLMDATHFQLWKACDELTALLWFPKIHNQDEYLNDLSIAVGPLLGSITESFESYNAVFRYSSIFSNGLAPSRDIAIDLAGQESLKHRLFGGFWPSKSNDGQWVQAGTCVRDVIRSHPLLQRHLGWTELLILAPVKYTAMNRRTREHPTIMWPDTKVSHAVNASVYSSQPTWAPCIYLIAKSQDKCIVRSWVCGASPINGNMVLGQITEILSSTMVQSRSSILVLDQFELAETRDLTFGMPSLHRRMGERTYIILPTTQVDFSFNVQHNCHKSRCSATETRLRQQERQDSGITERYIKHKTDDHYIINTHSLHNSHLIRRLLPRYLTAPIPLFQNCAQKHAELAAQLRSSQGAK